MRLIADASVDEIVLAFLRAEVDCRRYREFFAHLGLDRRLLEQPDLTDSAQNRRDSKRWPRTAVCRAPPTTAPCRPTQAGSGRRSRRSSWAPCGTRTT